MPKRASSELMRSTDCRPSSVHSRAPTTATEGLRSRLTSPRTYNRAGGSGLSRRSFGYLGSNQVMTRAPKERAARYSASAPGRQGSARKTSTRFLGKSLRLDQLRASATASKALP